MFDVWVSGRLEFSDDDRRECLDTVVTIIEMANTAIKNSLLSLESDIQDLDDVFLRKGMTMCFDSMPHDYIRNVLQNFIIAGNYRGGALLKRMVIMEGVFSILNCESPIYMYECTFASLFGEDFLPEYEEYCTSKLKGIANAQIEVEEFLKGLKGKELPEGTNLLEDIFKKIDYFAVREIMREIDGFDLRIAIFGSPEFVVRRFFDNMSRRCVEQVVSDCNMRINVSPYPYEIIAAQNRILAKIKELEAAGRIVIK